MINTNNISIKFKAIPLDIKYKINNNKKKIKDQKHIRNCRLKKIKNNNNYYSNNNNNKNNSINSNHKINKIINNIINNKIKIKLKIKLKILIKVKKIKIFNNKIKSNI